jgi:hypothetical protein
LRVLGRGIAGRRSLMQCPVCGEGTKVVATRTEAKVAKDPGLVRAGKRALARLDRRGEEFVVRKRQCTCGWSGKTVEIWTVPSTAKHSAKH